MQKSGLTTGSHHAIFRVLEDKRSKNITKIEQETVFVYTPGFIFYGVSHAKTDLHNKYKI